MLHYKTIDPRTLELLKSLLEMDVFSRMRLVGGTALALHLGHRQSEDIDLFGEVNIDSTSFEKPLRKFKSAKLVKHTGNILVYTIEGIKVDIVNYSYPWLENVLEEGHIKLARLKDISAMKLAAITGRGTKKDFIDIYELLKHFSLTELLKWYQHKYHDGSVFLVLKSLTYFEDAESDLEPVMFTHYSWTMVKEEIIKAKKNYLKSLES